MKHIAAAASITLVAGLLMSCNATFTGPVAVKGNEPFTYLALSTKDHGELRIAGPLAAKIRAEYQNRTLTVEGRITAKGTGPGFPPVLDVTRIVRVE